MRVSRALSPPGRLPRHKAATVVLRWLTRAEGGGLTHLRCSGPTCSGARRLRRVRSLKVFTGSGREGSPNVRAFLLTVEGPLGRGERGDKSGWAAPLPLRPVAAPWSLKSSWGWRDGALRLRGVRPAIPHEPGGPRGSRRHLASPSRSWWLKARPWHYHTGINGIGPGYTICGTQGRIKVWAFCSKRLQALMAGTTGHYTKRRPSEQGARRGCPGSTPGVTVIFHLLPPAQFLG